LEDREEYGKLTLTWTFWKQVLRIRRR
jgi:hypothetical protein